MKPMPPRPTTRALSALGLLLSLCGPFLAAPAAAASGPTLAFTADAVEVSSVTPEGRTAVLGVSRWPLAYSVRVEVVDQVLEDADGDGVVRLDRPDGYPQRTLWVALDLASGETAIGRPGGRASFPASVAAVATVEDASVSDQGRLLAVLVARPGAGEDAGAWFGLAIDGGGLDSDGRGNGGLTVAASRLAPMAGADAVSPPTEFVDGDVVVGIDGRTLEPFLLRPMPPQEGGAR